MKYFILILACSLLALPAMAQGVANFSYQRGNVVITRAHPPALPAMPWQDTTTPTDVAPAPVAIDVDIRDASSFYRQEGWMDLSGLQEMHGLLLVFEKPQAAHVRQMSSFAPLDIIWVDPEGVITSIAPSLVLANLEAPISDPKPSKTLLLVAGGLCAKLQVKPGDVLSGLEFFVPPPDVQRLAK